MVMAEPERQADQLSPDGPCSATDGTAVDDTPTLSDFALRTYDKLRYADTDRQGHVNNAVFSTALETGRAEFLYDPYVPLTEPQKSFVIARLELDFRGEMIWPGHVAIGSVVESIGRSSFTLRQGLFQEDRCVAIARTVIVQIDDHSQRACPLTEIAVSRLSDLQATQQ
jgi:acyl-CoA thioester hydrolase